MEVLEVMPCVLLCALEAVEGGLRCWEVLEASEVLEVLEVSEVMCGVLFCTPEAVEGSLCLLEVSEVTRCVLLCMLEALEVLEVMRCVPLCTLEAVEGGLCLWRWWRCRGCWKVRAVCHSVCWRRWRVGFVCWRCCR